ncbi:MAG: HAMP domain-containing histidine kinase [Acidobacteriia bacterium]|nr:HAMP domain-containing histidine kinase [Terriglobia bacterium]
MSKFDLHSLIRRLSVGHGFRERVLAALRMVPRGRTAVFIGTSCALLILAGAMQLRWMSQVNQSQRLAAQRSLDRSLRNVVDDLEFQVMLLLGSLGPDADSELDAPIEYYRQGLFSWHELSQHGPAIRGILVYDLGAGGSGGLAEFDPFAEPSGFKTVRWTEDLEQVRRYIRDHGFPAGRGVKARWPATWMFHPGAMVLLRPIAAHVESSRQKTERPGVVGYLILELDVDYLRDRLIPKTLNKRFSTGPRARAYIVDITLDGNPLVRYERATVRSPEAPGPRPSRRMYIRSGLEGRAASAPSRPPDRSRPLLLSQEDIPDALLQRGAAQQVWINRITAQWRSNVSWRAPASRLWTARSGKGIRGADLATAIRRASGLPRLYVIADQKHELALEARHVGVPLAEAIDQEHLLAPRMAVIAVLVLLGATLSVAISRALVARTAELRTDAAASLAHQLLTPIATVVLIGESMSRGILGRGEKALEYGALVHRYGQRLQGIVDRSMQMAAMKTFKQRYNLTMLDVSQVAESALAEANVLIESSGFTVERDFAQNLPRVLADAEALQQVVGDLLSNAMKYGLEGRWLKVETCEAFGGGGREVQVQVRDRGPGIPAAEAARIFEPYYRIDNRITRSQPGAGLGLKLAAELVKGMGGSLSLHSNEGRGSVFAVHLPVPPS